MTPSEVRSRILSDHERLRGDLEALEAAVSQALDRTSTASLRMDTEAFLARLRAHMQWEESYLLPALREADAWGAERADALIRDHREQRDLLTFVDTRLRDEAEPAALLARNISNLIALLREDMRHEEAELLDERVLRDDVVAIDVETG
jgi:hypothetical protein